MNQHANHRTTTISANLPWLQLPRGASRPGAPGSERQSTDAAGWQGDRGDEDEDGSSSPSFAMPPTKPPRLSGGAAMRLLDGHDNPSLGSIGVHQRAAALTN